MTATAPTISSEQARSGTQGCEPSAESRLSVSRIAAWLLALGALFLCAPVEASLIGGSQPAIYQRPSTMAAVESEMHLARRRWEVAVETLKRSLHDQPDNVQLAQKLAEVHIRLEQYDKAIQVLEEYLTHSSAKNNLPFVLGYCHDKLNHFQEALGYYAKALRLQPGRLSIYVRAAQIRQRQGLVYDAAKVLRKALEIDRDFAPAIEELAIVNKLIKMNRSNVYRRGNMVILFRDYRQFTMIDRLYPTLEQHRLNLENNLKYHLPLLWVKVVRKIDHHENPPALNNWSEDVLLVTEQAVETQNVDAIAHELAYLYLLKMTDNSAPRWLAEGLALWESRPKFLSSTPLRSTDNIWPEELRFLSSEKKYLEFDKQPEPVRRQLVRAFALTRFLLDNYGWEGMRKILWRYREGETRFSSIAWQTLHIELRLLQARWNMYAITNFFFSPTTETLTWNTDKGPGNT
ncbi:MAG: tetratricopeptide repeat protein [Candidatus Riflebacteria bacterium]|nr:tetratricopeptide repeat protein [Candidatus Riflebacteria bacterium]